MENTEIIKIKEITMIYLNQMGLILKLKEKLTDEEARQYLDELTFEIVNMIRAV
jgi:hypothetical protein